MKKALLAIAGLAIAGVAYAQCVTNTYMVNGRVTICTTCCYGANCTTTCN